MTRSTPLRILIDARLIDYRRGMGNYVYHLVSELHTLDLDQAISICVPRGRRAHYRQQFPRFHVLPALFDNFILDEQITLPLLVARHHIDLLHSTANTAPLWLPKSVRLTITIHDVMYLLTDASAPQPKNLYQRVGKFYRRLVVPRAVGRAAQIITDSRHSQHDIQQHLPVSGQQVEIIHLAGKYSTSQPPLDEAQVQQTLATYGIRQPYTLYLGGLDPRKNMQRVLTAYAALPPGTRSEQLIVVGMPPAGQILVASESAARGIADAVICTPFIAERELQALYQAAALFVYPSLYEGFGLPVLEAMALGTPVVTSNGSAIPEIAGDAALLVDPLDVEQIAAAMTRVLRDPVLSAELSARGKQQAARFTWQQTAQATRALYDRLSCS